jgi:exosortase
MEISGKQNIFLKIGIIIISTLILYWPDIILLGREALYNETSSYILVIPFLLLYILYRMRKRFYVSVGNIIEQNPQSNGIPVKEITGLAVCLFAYVLKWYGNYMFQPLDFHLVSLPIFVAGLIILIFNYETLKIMSFPLIFMLLLIPPPLQYAYQVGSYLSTYSSQQAFNILKLLGQPVRLGFDYGSPIIYLQTSTIDIPFAIDIACSGLYSLLGFFVFAIFISYISRGPISRKLLIFLIGMPIIYSMNILRIIIIILIGHYVGPTQALNTFHLLGGFTLLLVSTMFMLSITEKFLGVRLFAKPEVICNHEGFRNLCDKCGMIVDAPIIKHTKIDSYKGILIIFLLLLSITIQVPVIALTQGAAEVFIQSPNNEETTKILPEIEGYELQFVYRDEEFAEISGQDASIMFQYKPEEVEDPSIWVGIEIGPTQRTLHPWELCLITWPLEQGKEARANQVDLRDIHLIENPPLSARYFAFNNEGSNSTEVILYWYTQSIFQEGKSYIQKWSKISVIKFVDHPNDVRDAEAEIHQFGLEIANYWKPLINWSWLALAIAESGPVLLIVLFTIITISFGYTKYVQQASSNRAYKAYSRLTSTEDLLLINSIKELKTEATECNIINALSEKIDQDTLKRKISEAEESGILKKKVVNIDDETYLIWGPNFSDSIIPSLLGKISFIGSKLRR